jgi:hypothetical protein
MPKLNNLTKNIVLQQLEEHKIWEDLLTVYNKAITPQFMNETETTLNKLDAQITEILLSGERLCAKDRNYGNHDPSHYYWQEKLYHIARQKFGCYETN